MPFAYFQRRTVTPSKTKEKKNNNTSKLSFTDKRANANEINDLQNSVDNSESSQSITQLQEKVDNKTGMPDELKDGVERLSGQDMSDVRVTYNSDKPAQLEANAYASGNNIHIGPGQEKHLPHEAWHVVQQKQNRVKPTIKTDSGELINDDPNLEKEADLMGQKSLKSNSKETSVKNSSNNSSLVFQRETIEEKRKRVTKASKGTILKDSDSGDVHDGSTLIADGGGKVMTKEDLKKEKEEKDLKKKKFRGKVVETGKEALDKGQEGGGAIAEAEDAVRESKNISESSQMDVGGGVADVASAANEILSSAESFSSAWKDGKWSEGFKGILGIGKLALTINDAVSKFSAGYEAAPVFGPIKSALDSYQQQINMFQDGKAFLSIQAFQKAATLDKNEKKLVKQYVHKIGVNFADHLFEWLLDWAEILSTVPSPVTPVALPAIKAAHGSYKLMKAGVGYFKDWREKKFEKADERLGIKDLHDDEREKAGAAKKLLSIDKKFEKDDGQYSVKKMVNAYMQFNELKTKYEKEDDPTNKKQIEKNKAAAYSYMLKGVDAYNEWAGAGLQAKIQVSDIRKLAEFHKNAISKIIKEVREQKESKWYEFKLKRVWGGATKKDAVKKIDEFMLKQGGPDLEDISIDDIILSGQADYFWGKTNDALTKASKRNGLFSVTTNKTITAEFAKLLKSDPARFEELLKEISPEAFKPGVSYGDCVDKFLRLNKI